MTRGNYLITAFGRGFTSWSKNGLQIIAGWLAVLGVGGLTSTPFFAPAFMPVAAAAIILGATLTTVNGGYLLWCDSEKSAGDAEFEAGALRERVAKLEVQPPTMPPPQMHQGFTGTGNIFSGNGVAIMYGTPNAPVPVPPRAATRTT